MTRARDKASAVVANFASTGIDDNADANAITINSSENVGIGVSDPSQKLDLVGTGNSGTGSVRAGGVGSGTQAAFIAQSQFGSASFGTYGSYPAVLNSSNSPMVYFNTNASGRAVFAEGITFNGDTAAANALDDYEEGTWTPVDGSGAGLSFTVGATSNYIKIGRLVLFNFYITYPSTSSTATASIGGLPYAVTSSGFFYANYRSSALGANNLLIQLNQGSTVMSLYNADAGYNNATLSGAYFLASGSYMTS